MGEVNYKLLDDLFGPEPLVSPADEPIHKLASKAHGRAAAAAAARRAAEAASHLIDASSVRMFEVATTPPEVVESSERRLQASRDASLELFNPQNNLPFNQDDEGYPHS